MALLLLSILFVTDLALARVYLIYPDLDIVFHFLGGFFVALFFIGFLKKALIAERSLTKDVVLIVGASILIGVIWEFFEFFTGFTPPPTVNIFQDTLLDLVMDIAGAATMFFVVRQKHRKSKMFK